MSDQLCFVRGNKGWAAKPEFAERKTSFMQFMNIYEEYLLTRDEIWDKKLKEVDEYIVANNRRHPYDHPLTTWLLEQIKQAGSNKMPQNRIDKWNAFSAKHEMFIKPNVKNKAIKEPINKHITAEKTISEKTIAKKCSGKDRHGSCCRNYATGVSKYCKYHAYMVEYSDDVIAALRFCKACQKWKQIEPDRMQCLHLCTF